MAELFVVNGICGGTVFFLPDVPTVLGRSPECHIQIADAWISSMHALFERRGDELWVVDLDSRNGTFLDDQRIHEAPVQPGARLRFGKTTAELRAHAGAVQPQGLLTDQRTIVRYIADVPCEGSPTGAWERTTPTPNPTHGPRAETMRGTGTPSAGSARRQVGVINEISRALLGAEGTEESLHRVVTIVSAALMAEHAAVLLLDEHGQTVPVVAEPPDRPPQATASIVEATLSSRAGVLTVDPQPDVHAPRSGTQSKAARSSICAPIWADNRILGVMVLQRYGDPFTADDLELVTVVGFHAALAVERARNVERARAAEEARNALLRHLDPAIAARFLAAESPDAADALEPSSRDDVAVLAATMVGVGALATVRPSAEVTERVLAIQRAIASAARAESAAVDERIDGGVVAVFGLTHPRADAPTAALRCARTMLERVAALEAVFDLPRLQLKIGIDSGRAVTGNFALPNRPEIRAVGEPVESALRLAFEAKPGEALAGPGASKRSRRAGDEPLEPRAGGVGALRLA